jgi:cytochrome c-type biogenesis protein CcmH
VTAFLIVAVLLSVAAVAVLLVPLWRQRRLSGRWSVAGIVAAVAIAPIAFVVYSQIRTWDPVVAHRADEEARLVEQLAQRLQQKPDDVGGWRLLARSYMALGRYAEGVNAYREAWKRTPMPDNELKLEYAEAQVLNDRAALSGEAGKLFEEVVAAEPDNAKALWYGGLAALEVGREDDVKARWTKLLGLDPPEEVAQIVRQQLAALGAPATGEGAGQAPPTGPSIKLAVSLGPGRRVADLGPNAALFIFARAPGGVGPPLAVIRKPADAVPGEFTLSDANSMIPGRSLADFEELDLVARLSKNGQPTAQPGDWQAQTSFKPKDGGSVALVIDQVVQ